MPHNHPMIQTAWAYGRLTHPWAVAIVMTATALFGLLASGGEPPAGRFALLLAGMLGGQLAIGASNEWRDRESDALDKPHRPIPAGAVSADGALRLTAVGLLVMLLAGALLGGWELALLAVGTGAGLLYNLWLKRTPLSWLPYLIALPLLPVWVWLVMGTFEPALLWLYPLGSTFVLAIHLAQTLPDIAADRTRGEHGLGVVLGRRWTEATIWTATFGSTLAVAAGARLVDGDPLPATLTAALVLVVLAVSLFLTRRAGDRLRPHLFKVLTTCAVLLATGWILTVTG